MIQMWKNGSTPFGDSDVDGIDYNTFWEGDNYAYFRHVVDIPDIGLYDGGFMSINVATNNYGDYYINGGLCIRRYGHRRWPWC